MSVMGNFDDINGKIEAINGDVLGHYWGNSRKLIGKLEDIDWTTRGHQCEISRILMGNSTTLLGQFQDIL